MSDKEPSAKAKEQAKEIVYYWRDQIAAGYEIHRDVLDDLAIDIAAALDAKDHEAERLKSALDRMHRDALGHLAKYGCTPEEGYVKAPHCLGADIDRLGNERDMLARHTKNPP